METAVVQYAVPKHRSPVRVFTLINRKTEKINCKLYICLQYEDLQLKFFKKRIKFHNEYILQFYNVQFTVYNSYNGIQYLYVCEGTYRIHVNIENFTSIKFEVSNLV